MCSREKLSHSHKLAHQNNAKADKRLLLLAVQQFYKALLLGVYV